MNLGTGRGYSVKEVIAAIEKSSGKKVPYTETSRRPGDPAQLVAAPARAEKLLNWKAKRSLEQIVDTAWKWFEKTSH